MLVPVAVVAASCALLSLFWSVPYIFTLIAFAAWALVGHLVTADDDASGGWSNSDGSRPFPLAELGLKAVLLAGLSAAAFAFPALRSFGGGQ